MFILYPLAPRPPSRTPLFIFPFWIPTWTLKVTSPLTSLWNPLQYLRRYISPPPSLDPFPSPSLPFITAAIVTIKYSLCILTKFRKFKPCAKLFLQAFKQFEIFNDSRWAVIQLCKDVFVNNKIEHETIVLQSTDKVKFITPMIETILIKYMSMDEDEDILIFGSN